MTDMIILLKDEQYDRYIPYVNGHGIKVLPSEVTRIIDDLMVYSEQFDDTIKLQNMQTEQHIYERK